MNWYEALYFGLNSAALQNAAGQFVAPSSASIDAALADATTNPDGTLAFTYTDTSDAAAYPEPVSYTHLKVTQLIYVFGYITVNKYIKGQARCRNPQLC